MLVFGGDDEVRLEHALALYQALLDAELATVPGTSHGVLVEQPDLCNATIVDCLTHDRADPGGHPTSVSSGATAPSERQ